MCDLVEEIGEPLARRAALLRRLATARLGWAIDPAHPSAARGGDLPPKRDSSRNFVPECKNRDPFSD